MEQGIYMLALLFCVVFLFFLYMNSLSERKYLEDLAERRYEQIKENRKEYSDSIDECENRKDDLYDKIRDLEDKIKVQSEALADQKQTAIELSSLSENAFLMQEDDKEIARILLIVKDRLNEQLWNT